MWTCVIIIIIIIVQRKEDKVIALLQDTLTRTGEMARACGVGAGTDVINNTPGAIISLTTSNHINTHIRRGVISPVINSVAGRGRLRLIIKAD